MGYYKKTGQQQCFNPKTGRVIPQEELIQEEQRLGIAGLQTGGSFRPTKGTPLATIPGGRIPQVQRPNISPVSPQEIPVNKLNQFNLNQNQNQTVNPIDVFEQGQGQSIFSNINQRIPRTPQGINIPDPVGPNISPIPVQQSQQIQPINPVGPVIDPIQGTQQAQPLNITGPVDPVSGTQIGPQVTYPTTQQSGDPISVTYPTTQQSGDPFSVTYPTTQQSGDPIPDQVETPVDPTVETPEESQFADSVKFALGELRRLYQGGSPAQRAAYQKAIDDLKATQATERRVAAQQAAQERVGGVEAQTRQLVAARDAGSQLAQATAQMGIADLQARENALTTMAQIGLQGQQAEQAADQWQQQFDFAKEKYGDLEGQRMFADINAGMTFDQIQAKYPQSNITQQDFDSMQNATPMSQWEKMFGLEKEQFQQQFDFAKEKYDFDKQMSSINALIQQGGAENFEQASNLFKNMFGEDIDFSNALSAENSANFNDGMAQMSAYLASGMDWEQAFKAMQEDGSFEKLGMIESDVEKMYNQMRLQSNPIWQADQAYQDLVESGVITQDMKDQIMDVMMFSLSNPEGIEITPDKFVIKDANGRVMGEFDSQGKANMFMQANGGADKGWSSTVEEGKIQLADTSTGTGTTGQGTQAQENQGFADFENQIPTDLLGNITQEAWVQAGKPKTWEEYTKVDPLGAEGISGSIVEGDPDVANVVMSRKDIKKIMEAIDSGNKIAIDQYKLGNDIEDQWQSIQSKWDGNEPNFKFDSKEDKDAFIESIDENLGKIIHLSPSSKKSPNDIDKEGNYVIVNRGWDNQGRIVVGLMNAETGDRTSIVFHKRYKS
jgi:hypothetical protein